jgi:uncharacterized protein YggU (UPF0235/DUF167 family)
MLIKVKVFEGREKDEIIEKKDDEFEVRVKEKTEEGRANRAVIKVLANYFKVDESKIILIKSFKERNKIFEIKRFNKNPLLLLNENINF